LKGLGILFIVVGVTITFGALFITTSVSTETPTGLYGSTRAGEVYNLGLLQRQMMVFITGLAISISGVVITAAGTALDTIGIRTLPTLDEARETIPANVDASEAVTVQRELTPTELAERDRDLNRATFMVAGVLVAVIGAVFLFVLIVS
jgi:hypothetical protein